jgi:hypothetical protein
MKRVTLLKEHIIEELLIDENKNKGVLHGQSG